MSNKKCKTETSVANLINPRKIICMNIIVFVVVVKKLTPVPKKNIQQKNVYGNRKIIEKIRKIP